MNTVDHKKIFEISKPLHEHYIGENLCGIYFLMNGEECVYIGQGINVYKRVGDHQVTVGKRSRFNKYNQRKTNNLSVLSRWLVSILQQSIIWFS